MCIVLHTKVILIWKFCKLTQKKISEYDFFEIMKHYDNSTTTVPPGGRDALNLAQFEWPRKGLSCLY